MKTDISFLNHWLARYLERRGWVVFYLDEEARKCRAVCWMDEYQKHKPIDDRTIWEKLSYRLTGHGWDGKR